MWGQSTHKINLKWGHTHKCSRPFQSSLLYMFCSTRFCASKTGLRFHPSHTHTRTRTHTHTHTRTRAHAHAHTHTHTHTHRPVFYTAAAVLFAFCFLVMMIHCGHLLQWLPTLLSVFFLYTLFYCLQLHQEITASFRWSKTGPSYSKLMTSLVNVTLKLWSSNMAYTLIFLLKKCE